MGKNIKLFITTILLSILLLTSSNAELINKVIISVGDEMITNYDLDREIKYLNVITVGRLKNLNDQELRKYAVDSLIKDKIKITALTNYNEIIINDEVINNQIVKLGNGRLVWRLASWMLMDRWDYVAWHGSIVVEPQ